MERVSVIVASEGIVMSVLPSFNALCSASCVVTSMGVSVAANTVRDNAGIITSIRIDDMSKIIELFILNSVFFT